MARKKVAKKKALTPGQYIDRHYALKMQRDKIIEKLKEKKQEIAELEEAALEAYSSADIEGARGRRAVGFVQTRDVYSIRDRSKLDKYVLRHKRTELFQARVSQEAVEELLFEKPKLKLKTLGLVEFELKNFRTRNRG